MRNAKISSGECRLAALIAMTAFTILYALLCWIGIEWSWETADAFAFGMPWGVISAMTFLLVTKADARDTSGDAP
ncbi:hypothetical protein [Castellaniella sp.]|uniref:hypothetical protein n=1 Tax=Castellaniella sp. TaxID=1955812 RepID=UPI002AFDDD13|nr:hypothetical protein [Castellaniella sp.]